MADKKETWKNATKGRVAVLKVNRLGQLEHEIIRGGGTLVISTDERLINQDRSANDDLNVFKNGTMVPVRLIEDSEDAAEILSNPNLKSEDELSAMFKLQWKKFEVAVGEISNATTLHRLKELASEVDATIKQVNVIESRLSEVDPSYNVVDVTLAGYGAR